MHCLEWSYSCYWFCSRYNWKDSYQPFIVEEYLCCVNYIHLQIYGIKTNSFYSGLHWGAYTRNEPERIPEVWKALFDLFESGKLQPALYDQVYTLETIPQGLMAINNRASYAKVVAKVSSDDSKL